MATRRRGWVWMVAAVCAAIGLAVVVGVVAMRRGGPPPDPNAVVIMFLGYTNPAVPVPGLAQFALLCVSNKGDYTIRWHQDWVEMASGGISLPDVRKRRARILNPSVPGAAYPATLAPGASILMAVEKPVGGYPMAMSLGEPVDPLPRSLWRFGLSFSRYSLAERWLDLSFKYHLPTKLGPIVVVDRTRILDPSNQVKVYSRGFGSE